MRRTLFTVAWLTCLWVMLWRDASAANVAVGALVAAAITAALGVRGMGQLATTTGHRVRPVAIVKFLGYFAWKLIESNIVIAREVVTPQNHIQTGIIGVAMPDCSALIVTIVANAVSLTPGTLTLEVHDDDPPILYVHVLHLESVEVARADVRRLTDLVRAALPPQFDATRTDATEETS